MQYTAMTSASHTFISALSRDVLRFRNYLLAHTRFFNNLNFGNEIMKCAYVLYDV